MVFRPEPLKPHCALLDLAGNTNWYKPQPGEKI